MDDIMVSHTGPVAIEHNKHNMITAKISTKFYGKIKTRSTDCELCTRRWGGVCY